MRNLLVIALTLSLLGGCASAARVSVPESDAGWACTPVDPHSGQASSTPCFRARLTAENEITLEWRVVNAGPQVYILDDFGAPEDIGFQPANCTSDVAGGCSTKLRLTAGGLHRWQLQVANPDGTHTYVATSITVPEPHPPAVYGGGFVDVLSPSDHTVSWIADSRNAPCDAPKSSAWIEIETSMFVKARYPRCGRAARLTIRAAKFREPGFREYKLRDCHLPEGSDTEFCSPYVSASFEIGSDHFLGPSPVYADSGRDLEIAFTNQSGDVRRLSSATLLPQPVAATTETSYRVEGQFLTPGVHSIKLQSCNTVAKKCSPEDELRLLVDVPVQWELGRDYTEDFHPGVSHPVLGAGAPLEITYDDRGGIWLINEFSNSIEYVSPEGVASSFTVPLARDRDPETSVYKPVRPFAVDVGIDKLLPASTSTLGERATRVGSTLWFTQGGGMVGSTEIRNHSRVISYDPSLTDSPATPYDDRMCVYNVPADEPGGVGNNQVIGLTAADDRIWIAESRGLFDDKPSAISSFIANPDNCGNLLDFEDPDAVARQSLQYCGPGQTPEQDGCMQKFLLDKLPTGIKVAHLATDPDDGSIWFTDAHGVYLGNLDPRREKLVDIYPLPDSHVKKPSLFRGFPWSIKAEEDAVYFAEFSSRQLLRFDKANKTFDEIDVPGVTGRAVIPSIEIDEETDRLWFTLSNGLNTTNNTVSTMGYVDLASWRAHVADPARGGRISGVIYKGLDTIGAVTPTYEGRGVAFAGIAIDADTGKLALASSGRHQITELIPRSGFWP